MKKKFVLTALAVSFFAPAPITALAREPEQKISINEQQEEDTRKITHEIKGTANTAARLRAGPSTDADIKGMLYPGWQISVLGRVKGQDAEWLVCMQDEETLYIRSDLVDVKEYVPYYLDKGEEKTEAIKYTDTATSGEKSENKETTCRNNEKENTPDDASLSDESSAIRAFPEFMLIDQDIMSEEFKSYSDFVNVETEQVPTIKADLQTLMSKPSSERGSATDSSSILLTVNDNNVPTPETVKEEVPDTDEVITTDTEILIAELSSESSCSQPDYEPMYNVFVEDCDDNRNDDKVDKEPGTVLDGSKTTFLHQDKTEDESSETLTEEASAETPIT